MKNNTLGGAKVYLLVIGLVLIAIALIGGIMIGNLLPTTAFASPDSLTGWIATTATVVIGILTVVLAAETWKLRDIQSRQIRELVLDGIRPNVSVELIGSHVGMSFMNVRISNSGKGIARDIKFKFLDRFNQPVTDQSEPIIKVFHKLTMFRLGIQSLGVNQEFKSYIFSFLELEKELGVGAFTPYLKICIEFCDTKQNKYENEFVVDFAQYEGFSEIGGNSLALLADELKLIRTELGRLTSGSKRLTVDIHSAEDRSKEQTRLLKMRMEARTRIEEQKNRTVEGSGG